VRALAALRRAAAAAAAGWDRLAPRERTLARAGAALVVAALAARAGLAVRDDFAALERRVATAERDLLAVRRLAARLGAAAAGEPADAPLVTRLEQAAEGIVGRERIAAIAPADERRPDAGLALRVSDASLAETVRLLHALEAGPPALGVTRLELARHADDPGRFGLRVEVTPGGGTP
jgi:hypothetical protein